MGLAVTSLTPVEETHILYRTYYRLPAILSMILPRGDGDSEMARNGQEVGGRFPLAVTIG
jgi:hypothetical protein